MRLSTKQYRDQMYRLRAHPESSWHFHDRRDSFATVYLSLIPFSVLEYGAEVSIEFMPGGLVFPVGFLLFWAFYYTYYKPGFLENRLTAPGKVDIAAFPLMVLGILIWFVKVTLVELSHLLLIQWWIARPAPKRAESGPRFNQAGPRPGPRPAPAAPPPLLAPDLLEALRVLGLKPGCTWRDIHKAYRSLAKQFHPDLNPDITDFGNRFMKIDAAYHKLDKVRAQHFRD